MTGLKDIWHRIWLTGGLVLSVLCAVVSGCAADVSHDREELVPIVLTTSVGHQAETRAGDAIQGDNLDSDERIRVTFDNNATTETEVVYKSDGNGGTSIDTDAGYSQPYFTFGATSTTVRAYYPSTERGTSTSFTVADDQRTTNAYKTSDLMYAEATLRRQGGTVVTANLPFEHKLSKVVVVVNASGVGVIRQVCLTGGFRTVPITDPLTCTLSTDLLKFSDKLSEDSPLLMYSGDTEEARVSCAAVLPPQRISSVFLKVVTDRGIARFTVMDRMEAGKVYTIELNVNAITFEMLPVVITDWTGSYQVSVRNSGSDMCSSSSLEAVDMGLPSGTLWANMNVGATSVTDAGGYYAWGETTTKRNYVKETCKYYVNTVGSTVRYSKYITSAASWGGSGDPDGKTVLDAADDAATVNMGDVWRTPTADQINELHSNCNWTYTTDYLGSGVAGFIATSRINSNTLFFPHCAQKSGTGFGSADQTWLWSSTSRAAGSGSILLLNSVGPSAGGGGCYRYWGLTVRAVRK